MASPEGELAILNEVSGQAHTFSRTQSDMLRAIAERSSIAGAVDYLSEIYPSVPPAILRADLLGIAQDFVELGIIVATDQPQSRLFPTSARPADFIAGESNNALSRGEKNRLVARCTAPIALMGALAIGKLAPHKRRSALSLVQTMRGQNPASYAEAAEQVRAIQRLGHFGRLACLESSYAAALALAVRGKSATWHTGISFRPREFHAWIEAESQPVTTALDGEVGVRYQSFYR